ncbi:MAG TPA: FliH/SctL family protein [Nitrospiria bacterium]|nr:FliH/SctL family protein [Nitrospiria bacterium]
MSSSKVVKSGSDNNQRFERYALKNVRRAGGPPARMEEETVASPMADERQAQERGFSIGERAGREVGLKANEAVLRTLESLLEEIKDLRQELLKTAEKDIVKISIAIARKIVRQEIHQHPEWLEGFIQEAVKKLGKTDTLTIRIHPQDLERLHNEQAGTVQLIDEVKWLRFEPDAALQHGECVVSSREQTVDMRIDSQLAIIQQEMERAIDEKPG